MCNLNEQLNENNDSNLDDKYDMADSYYRIYGNEWLSSHFPEPETDRYP